MHHPNHQSVFREKVRSTGQKNFTNDRHTFYKIESTLPLLSDLIELKRLSQFCFSMIKSVGVIFKIKHPFHRILIVELDSQTTNVSSPVRVTFSVLLSDSNCKLCSKNCTTTNNSRHGQCRFSNPLQSLFIYHRQNKVKRRNEIPGCMNSWVDLLLPEVRFKEFLQKIRKNCAVRCNSLDEFSTKSGGRQVAQFESRCCCCCKTKARRRSPADTFTAHLYPNRLATHHPRFTLNLSWTVYQLR